MIFVTVGTDTPFDRLITAMDQWAVAVGCDEVFAQIGPSRLRPRHIQHATLLEPPEFVRYFRTARLVVSHAGMGTILTARQYEKPLIIMPRHSGLGETRNDHQLATARRLSEAGMAIVAHDERELVHRLAQIGSIPRSPMIGAHAQAELIAAIRSYIQSGSPT